MINTSHRSIRFAWLLLACVGTSAVFAETNEAQIVPAEQSTVVEISDTTGLSASEMSVAQSIGDMSTEDDTEAAPANDVVVESEAPVAISVEELKKKVIQLNRDLFILEEDLLFPANTQFVVFLSLNSGKFLALDSVKLLIDDEVVAAHLYTDRQLKALQLGGMQRLHLGNLKQGGHEITAYVYGVGPDQRPYKLAHTLTITKGTELQTLEIKIEDQSANFQPRVEIVEWEE